MGAVIGTDRGGIPGILTNIGCGAIEEYGNDEDLQEAICNYKDRKNINNELCKVGNINDYFLDKPWKAFDYL